MDIQKPYDTFHEIPSRNNSDVLKGAILRFEYLCFKDLNFMFNLIYEASLWPSG